MAAAVVSVAPSAPPKDSDADADGGKDKDGGGSSGSSGGGGTGAEAKRDDSKAHWIMGLYDPQLLPLRTRLELLTEAEAKTYADQSASHSASAVVTTDRIGLDKAISLIVPDFVKGSAPPSQADEALAKQSGYVPCRVLCPSLSALMRRIDLCARRMCMCVAVHRCCTVKSQGEAL
jgi:hypothetical protein